MRVRGAVVLVLLSALAPACGGGGGKAAVSVAPPPPPPALAPLPPVDTSTPDHVIDTSQAASAITAALQAALNAGGVIVFNNGAPVTIAITAELRVPDLGSVVLDGKNTVTLTGSSTRRILMKGWKSDLTVQRLSFIDARAAAEGAAICVENWDGSLTVIDCQFQNCKTTSTGPDIGGGAIRPLGQRHLQVSGCSFTDCDGSNGGAICSIGSRITIIDSQFSQCNAFGSGGGADRGPSGQGGIGGAVYVDGVNQNGDQPRLDLAGCTFSSNSAVDHAGALFAYTISGSGSFTTLDQCTFSGNSVTDASPGALGFAGAVYQQSDSFSVTRCTFDGNTSAKVGGALWSLCATGALINSTFQGNQAAASPGFGGALNISGTFAINGCTIAQNHGGGWGGGIFTGSASTVTLRNTLLMNNTGTNAFNGWNVNAKLADGGNNLQWPTTRGPGGLADTAATDTVVWADAQLQALGNNGGPTRTMGLPTGSPALDAGSAATAPATDQRGFGRVGAPDAGAFERQ